MKNLICIISHGPHFESCFPILVALHARDQINVIPLVNRRLKKTEPNIIQAFKNTGLKPKFRSRLWLELLSYFEIKNADAILTYGDPLALPNKLRMRDHYLTASRTPSIFVQHGLMQEGINCDCPSLTKVWYSSRILWWEDYVHSDCPFLTEETGSRIRKVGFIKKNYIPPQSFSKYLMRFIRSFKKTLLVCTTIPGHEDRFDDENVTRTYKMFDIFCSQNPNVLMLLRPHRGKQDQRGKNLDGALVSKHNNILVMDRYSGPFKYTNIHDSLAISDMVLCHASSVALDAVYADLPMALLHNDWKTFKDFPQVSDLEGLQWFVDHADTIDLFNNKSRMHFGELDSNLQIAAEHIEKMMDVL